MESGKLKASFRDIYYVSTAKEKSWQQAHHRIKGNADLAGDNYIPLTEEDQPTSEEMIALLREGAEGGPR